jgi:hypothetical protein
MGVSCGATIIVGFEVHHEDFWTERTITPSHVSCPEGHLPKEPNEKFCSQCGGKFGLHTTTELVCNPYLAQIVGDADPQGRAGEAWNPERVPWLEEQSDPSVFGIEGLELRCIDGIHLDKNDHIALGVVLLEVRDILGWGSVTGPCSVSPAKIASLVSDLRNLATKLGIDREPRVYLVADVG